MKLKLRVFALATICAAAITGCGSDNAAAPAPTNVAGTDIPIVATTSSESASIFVKGIVLAGGLDTADALTVGDVALATSETDEPDASI